MDDADGQSDCKYHIWNSDPINVPKPYRQFYGDCFTAGHTKPDSNTEYEPTTERQRVTADLGYTKQFAEPHCIDNLDCNCEPGLDIRSKRYIDRDCNGVSGSDPHWHRHRHPVSGHKPHCFGHPFCYADANADCFSDAVLRTDVQSHAIRDSDAYG